MQLILLSLLALATAESGARRVSFWYAPNSYGGGDINATVELLRAHKDAVTNLFVYCGHSIDASGLAYNPKTGAYCLNGLMRDISALGMSPEIVVDSGSSNVSDYRAFFANGTAHITALVAEAARFGAKGVSFDLEPQVGKPASTAADAALYAAFLAQARRAFQAAGLRTTVAAAQWGAMIADYSALGGAVDRVLDMETYNADSMAGWLAGDAFGGYYDQLLAGTGALKAAPGLGAWNATCGDHACWTTTAASGAARMARVAADGVQEVALFRIVQQDGAAKMPQEWWWPLLADFLQAGNDKVTDRLAAPVGTSTTDLVVNPVDKPKAAAAPYFTAFEAFDASQWSLEDGCSHCSGNKDECTQFSAAHVAFGAVMPTGQGANITSLLRAGGASACGGTCDSGHLQWDRPVTFGTFTVAARWFPEEGSNNVSTADGFIGLWADGTLGGSMTFIFHGSGWNDGSGSDFAHTFQSEVYRTGQSHNKINTAVLPDLNAEIAVFELEWLTDRVHWRVNGKLVRTWHPANNHTIPQKPMLLRLHSRSGHCSRMAPGNTFVAQLLNFSYTPPS